MVNFFADEVVILSNNIRFYLLLFQAGVLAAFFYVKQLVIEFVEVFPDFL